MFLFFGIGLLLGMSLSRLSLSGIVGLYQWKQKIIFYFFVPISLTLIYEISKQLFSFQLTSKFDILIGAGIGFFIQLLITKKRSKYYNHLKDLENEN